MTGRRGLTLIEVVIVVAIIAMSLGLAGPRIGAGLGRLDLNNSARTVQGFIKMARLQAQRADRPQYVVFDRTHRSVALVNADLQTTRQQELPGSIEIILEGDARTAALYVTPAGIVRGNPVRLRGPVGEAEVSLQ
jgi:prepilin-type N-terminal cleavage/methylation domain-containing protein